MSELTGRAVTGPRSGDRLLAVVDLVATMVFALEGALAGIVAGLDVLGVLVLGVVTATGGGIIRDLLIGDIPPASIRRPRYVASAVAAGVVAIVFQAIVDDIPSWLLTGLDAAGLSLFAVAGTVKALDFGLSSGMAAVMGTITGVGGGSVRDLLLGRIPAVLRVDVYATAALFGAVVVVATVRRWPPRWLMMSIGAAACFTLRSPRWRPTGTCRCRPTDVLVDVQFNPARVEWPELRELALAAEQGGYSAIWVFDHLAGTSLRGHSMLEAFTLLGALAATTSTIELGTMVLNVHHRSPAIVAVAAASVEAIADRPVHLGLGAGAAPGSRWSEELRAIGQPVEPTVEGRHARVVAVLDVLERMNDADRPAALATFPRWRHRSTVLLGANSRALAELAGRRTDGVNVGWDHPHRDELLTAAIEARGRRDGFALTTWRTWSADLLDPEHPQRKAMDALGIDRAVLVVPDGVTPDRLARTA